MVAKDGRFYLRLTLEEREMLDEVATALGLGGNASAAVRFMIRVKHREHFGMRPIRPRVKPKAKPRPRRKG